MSSQQGCTPLCLCVCVCLCLLHTAHVDACQPLLPYQGIPHQTLQAPEHTAAQPSQPRQVQWWCQISKHYLT